MRDFLFEDDDIGMDIINYLNDVSGNIFILPIDLKTFLKNIKQGCIILNNYLAQHEYVTLFASKFFDRISLLYWQLLDKKDKNNDELQVMNIIKSLHNQLRLHDEVNRPYYVEIIDEDGVKSMLPLEN